MIIMIIMIIIIIIVIMIIMIIIIIIIIIFISSSSSNSNFHRTTVMLCIHLEACVCPPTPLWGVSIFHAKTKAALRHKGGEG